MCHGKAFMAFHCGFRCTNLNFPLASCSIHPPFGLVKENNKSCGTGKPRQPAVMLLTYLGCVSGYKKGIEEICQYFTNIHACTIMRKFFVLHRACMVHQLKNQKTKNQTQTNQKKETLNSYTQKNIHWVD